MWATCLGFVSFSDPNYEELRSFPSDAMVDGKCGVASPILELGRQYYIRVGIQLTIGDVKVKI